MYSPHICLIYFSSVTQISNTHPRPRPVLGLFHCIPGGSQPMPMAADGQGLGQGLYQQQQQQQQQQRHQLYNSSDIIFES